MIAGKIDERRMRPGVAAKPRITGRRGQLFGGTALSVVDRSVSDVIASTRDGMPAAVVVALAKLLGMSQDAFFESAGFAKSTIKNRISQNKSLSVSEGDRVYRISRVLERALEVLEDKDAAVHWVQQRIRSLGGVTPLSLLDTEAGYELVLATLGRIEHGVVA